MSVSKYKVKHGFNWRFVISRLDKNTKKRNDICRGGFSTKTEARLEEAKLREQLKNSYLSFNSESTLNQAFDYWVERSKKKGVKKQTLSSYKHIFCSTFGKEFGEKKISSITVLDLQDFIDEITPSYVTLKNQISIANSIFDLAFKAGIIRLNPMALVVVEEPNLKKRALKKKYLNKEELKVFFQSFEDRLTKRNFVSDEREIQDRLMFTLLTYTGMRIGELLALTWEDIDLKNQTIHINKSQAEINRRIILSDTKTESSKRILPIRSKYTLDLLNKWKCGQPKVQKKFDGGTSPLKENLFYNIEKNIRYGNQSINYKISVVCDNCSLPKITAHAFRHTFATLLTEANVNKTKLSKYLGHTVENKNMTDNYTHTSAEYIEEIAQKADEIFAPNVKLQA